MYNCYLTDLTCILQAMSHFLRTEEKNITDAIVKYTRSSYQAVNRYLRYGTNKNADANALAIDLYHDICIVFFLILPYSPSPGQYLKLYRGVKNKEEAENLPYNAAFLSCSTDLKKAHFFSLVGVPSPKNAPAKSHITEILLLPNLTYKILPVESVTGCGREWEVILPPNIGKMIYIGEREDINKNIKYFTYVYLPLQDYKIKLNTERNVSKYYNDLIEKGNLTETKICKSEKIRVTDIMRNVRNSSSIEAKAECFNSPEAFGKLISTNYINSMKDADENKIMEGCKNTLKECVLHLKDKVGKYQTIVYVYIKRQCITVI